MEIADVRAAKVNFEMAMAEMVTDFESETQTKIEFIHIARRDVRSTGESMPIAGTITITITANI